MIAAATRTVLRGRESPLQVLRERLDALIGGRGGVVIVSGAAGMGRTSLLDETMAQGAQRGVLVRRAVCDVLAGLEPPGPLLTALADGTEPAAEQRFWFTQLTAAVGNALERTAADAPVLVAVDDVQWADPATLAALVALAERLAGQRILWLVAVRTGDIPPLVAAALDRLANGAATRVEADPLDLRAAAAVIADLLDADPGNELPAALAGTETQPLFLVELLRGLREQGMVDVADGTARLVDTGLPHRVRDLVAGQLRRLSADARLTVYLGAALGHRFTGTELATMAGRSPVAMLAAIEEAAAAGLLVPHGGRLGFRHELVRTAVEASLPAAVFAALRYQALTVRLTSGAPPTEVADLALEAARSGDGGAADLLDRAAAELGRAFPGPAVRLGRRAIELIPPGDPARPGLILRTAGLLVDDGRADEARALLADAGGELTGTAVEAAVRLRIAWSSLPADPAGAVEQGERCLHLAEVTPPQQVHCLALIACARLVIGDPAAADEPLRRIGTTRNPPGGPAEYTASLVPLALRAMTRHEWRRSLRLIADAVTGDPDGPGPAGPSTWPLAAWRAQLLLAAVRPGEALGLADAGIQAARRTARAAATPVWSMIRARALLDAGRLTEARAEAERLLDLTAPAGHLADVGRYIVGHVGLHAGGPADVDRSRAVAEQLLQAALPSSRRLGARLATRLAAIADTGPPPAEDLDAWLPTVTAPGSHADAIPVIRALLAAGAHDTARELADRLTRLAADHPDFPYLQASAAHAVGLVDADPESAATAVAGHRDDPRPLVRAAALEDCGRLLPPAARAEAVAHLTAALALYRTADADLDAARVRALLRRRGERRAAAGTRPAPPASNPWPDLTESELRVAQLAAAGSTNREIADRLHISPHTVNTHLRHIFDKLRVRSRVDLARMMAERQPA
ncbi:ATP-binding protein [Dactylosporangium sp. CA-233914]|uniref:ATP-binding protein n=1 Tax=Dactylosporangium sp. CA-233914 TaxID=3239934 RepID=UPI003D8DB39D